jgi:predicted GTPase
MASKLDSKGFVPIDFELAEFLIELSNKKVIVLGNKIDKIPDEKHIDKFIEFFPYEIDFFPVSLKYKIGLEPFLSFLQMICDEIFDDTKLIFWK